MREGIGHNATARLALEIIVTDGARSAHCLVDVAGFNDVFDAIGMTRPDSGEEISLQFESHGKPVVFGLAHAPARCIQFSGNAEKVLDVYRYLWAVISCLIF